MSVGLMHLCVGLFLSVSMSRDVLESALWSLATVHSLVCVCVCFCIYMCSVSPPAAEEPSAQVSVPGTTCWPWGEWQGKLNGRQCDLCVCVCVCVLRSLHAFLPFWAFLLNRIETQNNRAELSSGISPHVCTVISGLNTAGHHLHDVYY